MDRKRSLVSFSLGLLLISLFLCFTTIEAREINLALDKAYTFSREPNYDLCKDKDDLIHLTDGIYEKGYYIWTQKGTVGWMMHDSVSITIDLGKVEPISGVSVSNAAGAAGVAWPKAMHVFVSDDGKTFYHVGDLKKMSDELPPASGYKVHSFKNNKLETKGRYVRFFIISDGPSKFVFLDEIEVYQGSKEFLSSNPGKKVDNIDKYCTQLLTQE